MKSRPRRIHALIVTAVLLAPPFARLARAQAGVEQEVVEKARSLESRGLLDLAAQTWQQVLLSQPGSTEALAGLARTAKKQGKDAEAARYLERLRQLDPKNPQIAVVEATVPAGVRTARQARAEGLAAAGNYAGAMEIYRQLYGLHPPDDVALQYYDTEAATEAGREHAIAGLRELVKLHGNEPRYQVTLGRVLSYNPRSRSEGESILQRFPQDAAAQAALRQALGWDVQNPRAAATIRSYLKGHSDQELAQQLQQTQTTQAQMPRALAANPVEQAAYAALQANHLDQAEHGFGSLLDKDPVNPRALAGMGFVHMKQGNFDQAVSDFQAARQNGLKDPKIGSALENAHFWLTMGEAAKALEQAQLDVAAQRYRAALEQRATSPEALAGLAGTLLRDHQSGEAAQVFARWVAVQPNSVPAWRGLFMAETQAGQPQQALMVSRRFPGAVESALGNDPEYLLNLAAAYRATGDDAKAGQTLGRALNLPFPDDGRKMTASLRLQYAAVLAATNHYQQAAGLYRQVITEQPDDSAAWQGLILAQHLLHDDAGAVATLARMPGAAYDAARRDPGFLSVAAAVYQQQGRLGEAQALLEEAATMLSQASTATSIGIELQMAAIERQRNQPQRAAAIYRRVLVTDPLRADAWNGLLSTLHQSGNDSQAMAELAKMPAQVQSELSVNDDYLLTLSAIYSAGGNFRWVLASLSRLRARYAAQHASPPADVEIQCGWLLLRAGDEGELYSTLMRLGGRNDLTDTQRGQVQTIWAAWSVRRAEQAAGAGDTRHALLILNTAKEALAGNDEVRRSLASGYLTAGDAASAVAIFQSVDLASAGDYQGAIGAALAAKNLQLAENWLRVALELYPQDARILGLAARFEQARGNNGRARDYWKASLAMSPDIGAADRLARTLKVPAAVLQERRALESRDTLAALLGSAAGENRRTVRLPGEPAEGFGGISQADPAPAPNPPGPVGSNFPAASRRPHQGSAGERLGDYQPAVESPLSNFAPLPASGSSAFGEQEAVVDPQVDPGHASGQTPEEAAEALRRAADQNASTGVTIAPATIASASTHRGGDLTVRYADARQANTSSPALQSLPQNVYDDRSAPGLVAAGVVAQAMQPDSGRQPASPPSGLTDQQLVDSKLPPLRGSYVPAQPREPLSSRQEAQQEIASIDGGFSPWVGGTGDIRHRSGTPGFDQLTALEAPFEASTPLGTAARLTTITTPVFLDSGIADGASTLSFGSLPVGTIQPQQYADGVASELQLTAINFAARVGDTPFGFLVTNITGGVRWRPVGGPLTFTFSREPVRDTQLSYSGLRDPGSATAQFDGNIWGGVIANGGDVQVARGEALSGFYAGVGGQYITGQHVLTNTRFHGNAGAYWRVLTLPDLGTLVLGANFFGMHYAHNLRYFSYGQGGYFSPEAYFLAAMPLSWTGHYGADLHYNVIGSIGAQSFQEDSEPYFPLDPRLQSAFGNPLVPVRASVGTNYDLQSEIAYRVQDHWYVGGFLDFNNTRDYASQSGGFFVRYLFRPQPDSVAGPIGAFPRDGFRPVMVP